MDSNDENFESGDESNSMSTDTRNDVQSVKSERNQRRSSNIVFVPPNELEDWELSENRKSKRGNKTRKSITKTKAPKTSVCVKTKKRKYQTKKKPKKDSNPWSSDVDEDDDNYDMENEVSDDEYFRRLEESNIGEETDTIGIDPSSKLADLESLDDQDDYEDNTNDYCMKIFDSNNHDLYNFISGERERSLEMDDASKPKIAFPDSSNDLMCPNDKLLQLLSIYETVIQYSIMLKLSPFKLEDFISAMVMNENSTLLSELHMVILKFLIRDDDITNTTICAPDQKDAVNLAFHIMDYLTWPEVLRIYVASLENKVKTVNISPKYPFVSLNDRIDVLSFILNQFIYCNTFRDEISKEEMIHEDFCRVCHEQGKVICCETCPAVYHFYCLTPKLSALPETIWICPICKQHQIDGLRDCNFDAEKAIVEHKKTPLGCDRFGNTYWFIARRLVIEPRNDNIENLFEDDKSDDGYEPDYKQVRYYSAWSLVEQVRLQLSKEWEDELCSVFDGLVDEIRKSMQVTLNLTLRGMEKIKSDLKNVTLKSVLLSECYSEKDRILAAELAEVDCKTINEEEFESIQNCTLKSINGQQVGLIEDQDGLLVRNIDSNTIRVRLAPKTLTNQTEEVASHYNFDTNCFGLFNIESSEIHYRLGDEGDWRFYKNIYVNDPNAISKFQHQEDKDKRRILGNKFSINECNEFQWFISKPDKRGAWLNEKISQKKAPNDFLGGPLNMLQCIRLTLLNMETQIFSSFTCPTWRNERRQWLVNIQRTRNATNLAEFLATFQNALRPCIYKKSWNSLLGFLELERVTAAEKEDEKRIKAWEKRMNKNNDNIEITKTCNPGFLKHAIYKTKGEEYRRSGGDGWTWISATIIYNDIKLCLQSKLNEAKNDGNMNISIKQLLAKGGNMESDVLVKEFAESKAQCKIDQLIQIRRSEMEKYEKVSSLSESRNRLNQLKQKREEYLEKKKELDEKLSNLYKSVKNNGSRKRMFPFSNMTALEKRMRFGSNDSLAQYDGVDSADEESDSKADSANICGNLASNIPPPPQQNTVGTTATSKPTIINSPNRVCVLNINQFPGQLGAGGRIMLNNRMGTPIVTTNAGCVPGTNAPIRLPRNAILMPGAISINPNFIPRPVMPVSQAGGQIRAKTTLQNDSQQPQMVYVNNLANLTTQNGTNQNILLPGNQIRFLNNIQVGTMQNQQFKRILLPMDHNMSSIPIRPQQTVTTTAPTNTSFTQRAPTTTQQIRRAPPASRIIQSPTINIKQQEEFVKKWKEIDEIANQLLDLSYKLDEIDQEIDKLSFQCIQLETNENNPFELYQEPKQYCVGIINENVKDKVDDSNVTLPLPKIPVRNTFKFINESKDKNLEMDNYYSIFLYHPDNLRMYFLSDGVIDITGFDAEKKRFNMVNWPYPSARPNFSTTWCYHISRLVQNLSYYNTTPDPYQNGVTEPIQESGPASPGASGLSGLAFYLKMLWYCLRWDDMLTNWQDSDGVVSLVDVAQETLPNGDVMERKITKWRPLDEYYSRIQLLITICISSPSSSSSSIADLSNSLSHSNAVGSLSTRDESPTPSKRASKRSRKTVSMYADTDNFTDDGERDSDDSDPSFVPGANSTAVRNTPKSRGGRRGGRGKGGASGEDSASDLLHIQQEKTYISEWKDEDDIDSWEVRDYLMKIQWNRNHIQQPKIYLNEVLNGLVSKQIFNNPDEPVRTVQTLIPQSIIQSIQRFNQQQQQMQQSLPSQPMYQQLQSIRPTITTPTPQVLNAPGILQNQLQQPIVTQPTPTNTIEQNIVNNVNNQIISTTPVSISIPTTVAPIIPESITPKLIIESSKQNNIAPQTLLITSTNTPAPLSDIREVTKSNITAPSSIQQIPKQNLQIKNIAIKPNIAPNAVLTSSVTMKPSASITQVTPSLPITTPTPISTSSSNTIRGRGKGRGRGRVNKTPSFVPETGPISRELSSDDVDLDDDGDESNKYDDLKFDVEQAASDVKERLDATKQAIIDKYVTEAIIKADIMRQEQSKKEQQKTLSSKPKKSTRDSDDEVTDPETDSLNNNKRKSKLIVKKEIMEASPSPDFTDDVEDDDDGNMSSSINDSMSNTSSSIMHLNKSIQPHLSQKLPSQPLPPPQQQPIHVLSQKTQIKTKKNNEQFPIPPKQETVQQKQMNTSKSKSTPIPSQKQQTTPQQSQLISSTQPSKQLNIPKSKPKPISPPQKYDSNKQKMPIKSETIVSNIETTNINNKRSKSNTQKKPEINTSPLPKKRKKLKETNQKENIKQEKTDEELYCLCFKPYDSKKSYIGCDKCNNWFHFECVNMDQAKANKISSYVCPLCEAKQPHRREAAMVKKETVDFSDSEDDEAIYCSCREKYNRNKMYIGCDYCEEWYHPACVGMTDEEANSFGGKYKCPRCKNKENKKSKSTKTPKTTPTNKTINLELQIDNSVKKKLREIVNEAVKNDSNVIPIMINSKKDSQYHQIVRNPMDFTIVKANLENNKYRTLGAFKLDLQKIFTGCSSYLDSNTSDYAKVKNVEEMVMNKLKNL